MGLAMGRRGAIASGVCALAGGILAACSSPPPPPPPTLADVTLSATADSNPNASGQGAPVVVRLYQLSSAAGFEKAEFFRLLNQDAATLGADIVKKDEFLLAPGTSKSVRLEPPPTVKAVGVFAAFRDFSSVTWRGVVELPAHKTTAITVKLSRSGVDVSSKDASPKPGP